MRSMAILPIEPEFIRSFGGSRIDPHQARHGALSLLFATEADALDFRDDLISLREPITIALSLALGCFPGRVLGVPGAGVLASTACVILLHPAAERAASEANWPARTPGLQSTSPSDNARAAPPRRYPLGHIQTRKQKSRLGSTVGRRKRLISMPLGK
jgi:hypothetical protein